MQGITFTGRMEKLPRGVLCTAALMLFLAVVLRCFIFVFLRQIQVDFLAYLDVSANLLLGIDPYDVENVVFYKWGEPPIPFPGYMLFYAAPGLLMRFFPGTRPLILALHLLLQFLLLSTICLWTGRRLGWLRSSLDVLTPGPRQLGLSCLFFVICNSSPVLTALRLGQSTIFIAAAILFTVWYQGGSCIVRPALFGIAAVFKYTMVPFLGFLFLAKRKLKLCVYGAGVFFLFALSPLLSGNNLLELYQKYVDVLKLSMRKGSLNSYEVSGYDMIHIGFFKLNTINIVLIVVVLLLLILVLIRAWKSHSLKDETVLFVLCLTMLPTYHRLHDLVVILPLICLISYQALFAKRVWVAAPGLIFLGFMLLPLSLLNRVAAKIGPFCNDFIYSSSSMGVDDIFPLQAIFMILVTCWAFYVCHHPLVGKQPIVAG